MRQFRPGNAVLVLGAALGVVVQAGLGTPGPSPEVDLTATALVMGGTNQILSVGPSTPLLIGDYVAHFNEDFIAPTGLCVGGDPGCRLVAVYTPAQLPPFTGFADMTYDDSVGEGRVNLDNCIRGNTCVVTLPPHTSTGTQSLTDTSYVVGGISQGAVIAGVQKSHLIAEPVAGRTVSFVLLANPNRPNGGLLERFVGAYIPVLGISFNGATPTNSPQSAPLTTVDITRQYDGYSDVPTNPLNLLADLNALMGAALLHDRYLDVDSPALLQGQYRDTTYYLAPTRLLPLLSPVAAVPVIGMPIAQLLDAPLRVLVEAGYDRTINPGQPTPAKYLYVPNPIKTAISFANAIPTGWDDAISYVSGDPLNRPFRTKPQPVYGVGGPPVYAGAVDPYGPPPQPTTSAAESTGAVVAARSTQRDIPPTASAMARTREVSAQSPREITRRAPAESARAEGRQPRSGRT
ncbi:MAG: PE-PPE domain-containing protein [Mycobacterium sp.]